MEAPELDYELETDEDVEQTQELEERPAYFDRLDLTPEQADKLTEEVFDELEAIQQERDEAGLDAQWKSLWNQFKATTEEEFDTTFNLHDQMTKNKCRAVSQAIHQAYTNVDPKFSISPMPQYAREKGNDQICEDQQDFLDYKMDKVSHQTDRVNRLVELSACVLGTGIKKKAHEIKIKRRERKERYTGTPKPVIGPDGQPMVDEMGQPVIENDGLQQFLNKYPNAIEKYPQYVKQLAEGKTITIIARYSDTVRNDPVDSYVDLKNFYVRLNTPGYEGLCDSLFYAERKEYFYHELKAEEKNKNFFDVDELTYVDAENTKRRAKYQSEKYDILEVTYWFYVGDDDEPTRIICWFGEDKKKLIGCIRYPYDGIDSIYIPYYVRQECDGFYQPGIAEDLTDLNIAKDVFLNFGLEGVIISNTVTPITPRDSDIDTQFLNKEWAHGVPLNARADEVTFLQNFMKPTSVGDIITMLQMLGREGDDVSKVSSLRSGRESPIDPDAPASKTMALLGVTDANIRDYTECMTPSFNIDAFMTLQMYAQIYKDSGVKFQPRSEGVTGRDVFKTVSYETLIARTNIQSRAMAFDFDKLNEKQADIALLSMLLKMPVTATRLESIVPALKAVVKGWSPKWRHLADTIVPTLEQFKREQLDMALKATAMFLSLKQREAEATGRQLNEVTDAQSLAGFIQEYASQLTTGPNEGLQKNIEAMQKGEA